MEYVFEISGGDFSSGGNASSTIKRALKERNVDPLVIKRIVVALFEAEINVVAHADHGTITVIIEEHQVQMFVKDFGPGIEDIELAMSEGYSTASDTVREMGFGAGMGLPNIKKNADVFEIESVKGLGTNAHIIIYLKND
jgi:anti-sigma regulatory factor (Ser/Thr protein kinase)